MKMETILKTLDMISTGVGALAKLDKEFAIIHKQAFIKYGGRRGRLVWDSLVYHELTFVDEETDEHFSFGLSKSDEKTEQLFNELVERYGVDHGEKNGELIIRK